MRLRILVPLLGSALIAILAIAAPVLALVGEQRTQKLVTARMQVLNQLAEGARDARAEGEAPPDALTRHAERHRLVYGEHILILKANGDTLLTTGGLSRSQPEVRSLLRAYGYTPPPVQLATVTPWSDPRSLMAVPVEVGSDLSGGVVVLQVDVVAARADIRTAWLVGAVIVVVVSAVLIATTSIWSRWILRPVRELDEAAGTLATGQLPDRVGRTGPPELRSLATTFDTMATTLTQTLRQQQALVEDTSHQLRNPIAAVRLRVDLMARSAPAADVATFAAVQADLDRLQRTVDRLLTLAELDHQASRAPLEPSEREEDVLIDPQLAVERWAQRAELAGVTRIAAGEAVKVHGREVDEMVEALVDNAMKYAGSGATVRLRVSEGAGGMRHIEVDDSGPGLSASERAQAATRFWRSPHHSDVPGSGLGLAMVSAWCRASRGRMDVEHSDLGGLKVRLTLPGSAS